MLDISKTYTTKNHGDLEIVKYINARKVIVKFIGYEQLLTVQAVNIRSGQVRNNMTPTVEGIGFLGVGLHSSAKDKRAYETWSSMIKRCYNSKSHIKNPAYKDCSVAFEWHNFQNFAKWFYENYIDGFHLDKDMKAKGNRVYSKDTCLFISQSENTTYSHARNFRFSDSCGKIVDVYNLNEFCRKNNLAASAMYKVHSGKRRVHKGWTKP